ncbi:MAG TPA: hypothetical protein PLF71_03175 [bacterium]|nr:MAG: hypothetical protein BWY14_01045 [Parcubacteria group bacterium ADurb.Bin192]HPN15088.1 hypothetical protein [bacterium]
MESKGGIRVGVLMESVAKAIGINAHEAARCITHGFVDNKETARKLLLAKKVVLPAKPRTISVDVSSFWGGDYWGAYPNVRFSVSNEFFINRRQNRPMPLSPDMVEELVDETGDKEGAYYDMSRTNIWFMIGTQTLVEDAKRKERLLKQYGAGLNTDLKRMIEADEAELHFLDLKYPVDGSGVPRLGRDGWKEEIPFRLDQLMYGVDHPMLSDHPKKNFEPRWAGGTEAIEAAERDEDEEATKTQNEEYDQFIAITGTVEHSRTVSATGSKKSTDIVASGVMLCEFRRYNKPVFILMDIRTALRFCASFLCFRCSPGFVQAVGGALLLPNSLLPADALVLDEPKAPTAGSNGKKTKKAKQPAGEPKADWREKLGEIKEKLPSDPPAAS